MNSTFNSTIVETTTPTYFPTTPETLDIRATNSPLEDSFVPEGCSNDVDSSFPDSLSPLQESESVKVIFPVKDSFVRGGDYTGETATDSRIHRLIFFICPPTRLSTVYAFLEDISYGSSDVLELAGSSDLTNARKIIMGFDLASLSMRSNLQINSLTLRIFVDSLDLSFSRTVSIFKLPSSIQWDEDSITWESFGTPPIEKEGQPFQITQDDSQQWIDIDISEFIDWTVPLGQISLVMQNISKGVGNSRVSFASRETCHSPKLVVTTTS